MKKLLLLMRDFKSELNVLHFFTEQILNRMLWLTKLQMIIEDLQSQPSRYSLENFSGRKIMKCLSWDEKICMTWLSRYLIVLVRDSDRKDQFLGRDSAGTEGHKFCSVRAVICCKFFPGFGVLYLNTLYNSFQVSHICQNIENILCAID